MEKRFLQAVTLTTSFILRLNLVAMAQYMHGLSVIAVLPTPMPKLFTTLTLRLREIVTQIYG